MTFKEVKAEAAASTSHAARIMGGIGLGLEIRKKKMIIAGWMVGN